MDVSAFERLLGPCMDIMKSRMPEYEEQLALAFGSKVDGLESRLFFKLIYSNLVWFIL